MGKYCLFWSLLFCCLLMGCSDDELIDPSVPSDKNPVVNDRFEDPELLTFVLENYDLNGDGQLTEGEAHEVKQMILKDRWDRYISFTSLKGLELFTELEMLYLGQLDTVDVTPFTNLRSLVCDKNVHHLVLPEPCLLDSLACSLRVANTFDLYGFKNLVYLKTWIDDFSLILPDHPTLEVVSVDNLETHYHLDTLDLSGSENLRRLIINKDEEHISWEPIYYMNMSGCTALTNLRHSAFRKTDLTGCTSLKSVGDGQGTMILSGCTALTRYEGNYTPELDLSSCVNLEDLTLYNSSRESPIVISPSTKLRRLILRGYCGSLDVKQFPNLDYLEYAWGTHSDGLHHAIDVENCATLDTLITYSYFLTSTNFKGCTGLKYLSFEDNFESLDVSDCQDLELYCQEMPDLKFNKNIRKLYFGRLGHKQRSLDLSGCDRLEELTFFYFSSTDTVGLSLLNLDGCVSLRNLKINDVHQENLSLANCSQLDSLIINRSDFRNLDLSGCDRLRTATIQDTPIQSFSLPDCPSLEILNLQSCDLKELEMGQHARIRMVEMENMPDYTPEELDLTGCPALERFVMSGRRGMIGKVYITREQDVHLYLSVWCNNIITVV